MIMMMMKMMTMMTNTIPYRRTKNHIWDKVLMGIWVHDDSGDDDDDDHVVDDAAWLRWISGGA